MHKHSHVLIAEFWRDNSGISEKFAHPFGVHKDTPSAWGRAKPSDANPLATGRGNPLDQAERFITLVHPIDPARAREMAENVVELVNELDHHAGSSETQKSQCPHQLLAKSICEHADIASELLQNGLTEESLAKSLDEIRQAKAALFQLEGGIKGLLQNYGELEQQEFDGNGHKAHPAGAKT